MALTALDLCRDVVKLLGRRDTGVMTGCTVVVNDTRIMVEGSGEGRIATTDKMAC